MGKTEKCRHCDTPHTVLFPSEDDEEDVEDEDAEDAVDGLDSPDGQQPKRRKKKKFKKKLGSRKIRSNLSTKPQDFQVITCSSSCFPFVAVSPVIRHSDVQPLLLFFHCYLLLAISLHFSSSSAFLMSLFTQSAHLSCGLPRFLHLPCFFVPDLIGNLSSFILTMCPAHFTQLFTILPTV